MSMIWEAPFMQWLNMKEACKGKGGLNYCFIEGHPCAFLLCPLRLLDEGYSAKTNQENKDELIAKNEKIISLEKQLMKITAEKLALEDQSFSQPPAALPEAQPATPLRPSAV